MFALAHRFREWLHWRRLVRRTPVLRRCWRVVVASPNYLPGQFTRDAQIIEPKELFESYVYHQAWFDVAREELARGATSVAVITLEYLIKDAPQHRHVETHYVALPSARYLGRVQTGLLGY